MNAADAIILATGSGLFSDFTRKFFLFLSYVWQLMRASSSEMFLRISGLRVIARDSHLSI